MPRNGAGVHSVPILMTEGELARASDVNTDLSDISAEITNSLPRDGQAGMTGQMKAIAGTQTAPAYAFGADTDTGMRRKGVNEGALVAGGADVATFGATGLLVANPPKSALAAAPKSYVDEASPPGMIGYFATISAPAGWLVCNGQAVSRATYADLFAAIGTRFGSGNGTTTFTLPELEKEFIRGSGTGRAVGSVELQAIQSHAHDASASSAGSHAHTATTGSEGAHTHGGSTAVWGAHTHSGTANAAGLHGHPARYSDHSADTPQQYRTGGLMLSQVADSNFAERSSAPVEALGDQIGGAGTHTHSLNINSAGAHSHDLNISSAGGHAHSVDINAAGAHAHAVTVETTGGTETRPRNIALLICIKT